MIKHEGHGERLYIVLVSMPPHQHWLSEVEMLAVFSLYSTTAQVQKAYNYNSLLNQDAEYNQRSL